MLAIVIFVIVPALFAIPAHFARESRPMRYTIATNGSGKPVAIMATDVHNERSQIVRVLP